MSTKIFGIVLALLLCSSIAVAEEATSKTVTDETWNWMPAWRDKTDCGPNALYVLMNLEGHNVTLAEVKKLVPLDPVKGCSMEALIQAAEQLGFPLEAVCQARRAFKIATPFHFSRHNQPRKESRPFCRGRRL